MGASEMTEEEELRLRKVNFFEIKPLSVFYLAKNFVKTYHIPIKKISEWEWTVIELTPDNLTRIVANKPCTLTTLHLDDMGGLNV